MAYLLICVRSEDKLYGYALYSRQKAPVQFDESAVGIALRHDPCSNAGQYFLMRSVRVVQEDKSDANPLVSFKEVAESKICKCDGSLSKSSPICKDCGKKVKKSTRSSTNVQTHWLSFVQLVVELKLCLLFPSNLAYCCFEAVTSSKVFRCGFWKYLKRRTSGRWREGWFPVCDCQDVYDMCDYSVTVPRLIEISVYPAVVHVCHLWCYRVEGLVRKRMILEETMAWLSTLGGGYSSLGDYFTHFSEKAGKISVTQFRIAMEMGDPVMASKCRLFFALSLMQRKALKQSKILIRREYRFATSYKHRDQKLIDTCLGMWSKLQYLYSRRKKSRLSTTTGSSSKQTLSTTSNGLLGFI